MKHTDLDICEYRSYIEALKWIRENIVLKDDDKARIDELLTKHYFFWTEDDDTYCYELFIDVGDPFRNEGDTSIREELELILYGRRITDG